MDVGGLRLDKKQGRDRARPHCAPVEPVGPASPTWACLTWACHPPLLWDLPHLGLQAISRSSRSDQGGGSGEAPATQLIVSAAEGGWQWLGGRAHGGGGGQGAGSSEALATQLKVSAAEGSVRGCTWGEASGWEGTDTDSSEAPATQLMVFAVRAAEEIMGGAQRVGGKLSSRGDLSTPPHCLTSGHVPVPRDLGPHDARHISREIVLHADDLGAMHTVDAWEG